MGALPVDTMWMDESYAKQLSSQSAGSVSATEQEAVVKNADAAAKESAEAPGTTGEVVSDSGAGEAAASAAEKEDSAAPASEQAPSFIEVEVDSQGEERVAGESSPEAELPGAGEEKSVRVERRGRTRGMSSHQEFLEEEEEEE